MEALPTISVVTPSYNQGRFIEECFRSVIDQQYPKLEYIVIDGGSTDETVDIIRKYEQHFDFWVSEKDKGQSDAINRGLKRATGDIICWLNSDDYFLPNSLMQVAKAWQQSEDKSRFWCIGHAYEKIEETGEMQPHPPDFDCSTARLAWGHRICQPAVFWSRDIEQYLDESLHYSLDWELWIRISQMTRAVFLDDYLAVSRMYGETKTSTGKEKMADEFYQVSKQYGGQPLKAWFYRYSLWELSNQYRKNPNPKSIKFRIWTRFNKHILPLVFGKDFRKHYMWDFCA